MATNPLFVLRGELSTQQRWILSTLGIVLFLLIWIVLTYFKLVPSGILPSPWQVLKAFPELHYQDALVRNTAFSVWLNLRGYLEAIAIALPLGFLIGLVPLFRGLLSKIIDTGRYIPLTAVTGLFIAWFGLGSAMKVHFLAFGILVYLLPVVVQRIDEVEDIYLKTVFTLGANAWQTVRTVYLPAVLSRVSDDIRVLVAISWTYIIIAEMVGSEGGIGSLIFRVGQRQGRIDKVFALLIIIILIGFLQDRIMLFLDKKLFPYKYLNR
ncbi:MAG: ABC transporter permease subunit [Chitinophagales bacterium]|nr:ABC transporter permease subunit [Bacteroidota bacterium]MCB9043469.1 ABC transporter permease subunit [Chitinophagales bacterium]